MNKITENTLIPISLAVLIIGGASWMTTMYSKGEANAANVQKIDAKYESFASLVVERLSTINERLARIEEKLKKGD